MHLRALLAILSLLTLFATPTTTKEIPPGLRDLYNKIRSSGSCTGDDLLKGGFFDQNDGSLPLWSYCQRHTSSSAIYLKGPGDLLANMDVDCDGIQSVNATGLRTGNRNRAANVNRNGTNPNPSDTRCTGFPNTQPQTSFRSTLQSEGYGIPDLNPTIHPDIVLGNTGSQPCSRTFDPRTADIQPLSIVAVVCNNALIYGIWGDVNGDDGLPLVGEASLALATACFGEGVNGGNGWDGADVLYLAFKGDGAAPGPQGAKWNARDYAEFEGSILDLGDGLVEGLIGEVEADEEGGGCASGIGDNSGNGTYGGGRGTGVCGFNGSSPVSRRRGGGDQ
ncbi:fungal chitosanase of glycosyl hydrolase group 75-domain-containing protein [Aspergillus germanicus]